ncbi:hypothetical protein CYMTET_41042 [Cymbomonas tetramitiformis]|uniref:Uncharacterized protein n=1 Tax=Cymbomonas tetramitiformis TaxID=36881 RepID=A0AAE0C8M5_9CHLO|nr:hypothetical protein CYMTET_41042 [Cymbomonas tetramitiformis]
MARDMLMVDAELCEDMAVMREDDPELYTPMQDADEVAESYRKYVIRVELHNILNRLEVDYTDRNRDAVIANDTSGVLMRWIKKDGITRADRREITLVVAKLRWRTSKDFQQKQVAMLANQTKTDEDATMIPLHAGGGEGGGGGGGDGEGGGGDGEGGGGDGEGEEAMGEAMVKEKVERVAMVKEGEAMARGDAAMREEAMVTTAVEEFECTKRWCLRFARM